MDSYPARPTAPSSGESRHDECIEVSDDKTVKNTTSMDDLAEYLMRISERSFDSEVARRQSMLETSNRLLSCNSIISVALVTVFPILMDQLNESGRKCVLFVSVVILLLIAASIGVGVVSQYRFRYLTFAPPSNLQKELMRDRKKLKSGYSIAWHYANSLDSVQRSLKEVNDRISRLNKASFVLLGIALIFATAALAIYLVAVMV